MQTIKITPEFISSILKKEISTEEDMILEIISDWGISTEEDKSIKAALSYIHDELVNSPEDYGFSFRHLSLFILNHII